MKKEIIYKSAAITSCILVAFFTVAFYASGWSEPGSNPPDGDVAPFIDVSDVWQDKAGGLGVGGVLQVGDNISISAGTEQDVITTGTNGNIQAGPGGRVCDGLGNCLDAL